VRCVPAINYEVNQAFMARALDYLLKRNEIYPPRLDYESASAALVKAG
jgi:hypothetical protein